MAAMAATERGAQVWDDRRVRMLRELYPHVEQDDELVQELATRLGVSAGALRAHAKRLGLRRLGLRRCAAELRPWDGDEDQLLRDRLGRGDAQDAVVEVARRLRRSPQEVALRDAQLQRARAARIGSWSEAELHTALRLPASRAAAALGRDEQEVRLRRLLCGIQQEAEDQSVSLADAAQLLNLPTESLVEAVLAGTLSASPGRRSSESSPSRLPDEQWVTSEHRLGAWLLADPARATDPHVNHTAVIRLVAACGIATGRRWAAQEPSKCEATRSV